MSSITSNTSFVINGVPRALSGGFVLNGVAILGSATSFLYQFDGTTTTDADGTRYLVNAGNSGNLLSVITDANYSTDGINWSGGTLSQLRSDIKADRYNLVSIGERYAISLMDEYKPVLVSEPTWLDEVGGVFSFELDDATGVIVEVYVNNTLDTGISESRFTISAPVNNVFTVSADTSFIKENVSIFVKLTNPSNNWIVSKHLYGTINTTLDTFNEWFIDPINGSDLGDGSQLNPWANLQNVIDANLIETRFWNKYPAGGYTMYKNPDYLSIKNSGAPIKGGDTIYLMSGDHGDIDISEHYNNATITVKPYTNETPVIRSIEGVSTGNWSLENITVDRTGLSNKSLVAITNHGHRGTSENVSVIDSFLTGSTDIDDWGLTEWLAVGSGASITNRNGFLRNTTIEHVKFAVIAGALTEGCVINEFAFDGIRVLNPYAHIKNNVIKNSVYLDYNQNHDDAIQSWNYDELPLEGVVIQGNVIIDNYDLPSSTSSFLQTRVPGMQAIGLFDGPFWNWRITDNVIVVSNTHGISTDKFTGGIIARNILLKNPLKLDGSSPRVGLGAKNNTWPIEDNIAITNILPSDVSATNAINSIIYPNLIDSTLTPDIFVDYAGGDFNLTSDFQQTIDNYFNSLDYTAPTFISQPAWTNSDNGESGLFSFFVTDDSTGGSGGLTIKVYDYDNSEDITSRFIVTDNGDDTYSVQADGTFENEALRLQVFATDSSDNIGKSFVFSGNIETYVNPTELVITSQPEWDSEVNGIFTFEAFDPVTSAENLVVTIYVNDTLDTGVTDRFVVSEPVGRVFTVTANNSFDAEFTNVLVKVQNEANDFVTSDYLIGNLYTSDKYITKTLKPSGGDYTSISDWLSDFGGSASNDLVANNKSIVLECYKGDYTDFGGGLNYVNENINPAFTSSSDYSLHIYVPFSERHDGTPDTGFKIKKATPGWDSVVGLTNCKYIYLTGIEIEQTSTSGSKVIFGNVDNGEQVLDSCIVIQASESSTAIVRPYSAFRMTNSLIIGSGSSYRGFETSGHRTAELYNVVITGFTVGITGSSASSSIIRNTVCYNNVTNFNGDWSSITASNCASDKYSTGDIVGLDAYQSDVVEGDFVNAQNNDYHLSPDSGLIGAGVDLSSYFTTDIDGDIRTSWDIGYDEYTNSSYVYLFDGTVVEE
jgi:hypothetical protein